MTAPNLSDFQVYFNGLTLGPGTDYNIVARQGLDGLSVRMLDEAAPDVDGYIPGKHLADPKSLLFDLELSAADASGLATLLTTLEAAFTRSTSTIYPLHWKDPGRDQRFVWARCVARPDYRDWTFEGGLVRASVELSAADPRIYGATQKRATVDIFQTDIGVDLPVVNLPMNFPASGSGEVVASNFGNVTAWPLVRVFHVSGDTITRAVLTNITNDTEIDVTTAVAAGQFLSVDMDSLVRKLAVIHCQIDGQSRFGGWERPHNFGLSPGDNVLRLEIEPATAVGSAVLTWHDTTI